MEQPVCVRADESLVTAIVEHEWRMFTAVNEGSVVRASCQEDQSSFAAMRAAQFAAWSPEAAASYLADLHTAEQKGHNLLTEKYLRMMLIDTPVLQEDYQGVLPVQSETRYSLARQIDDIMLGQAVELRERYPSLGRRGRPLRTRNCCTGITSIQTYQLGELLTYSEDTLRLLVGHLQAVIGQGGSTVAEILANEMRFYGYSSLEQAEQVAAQEDDTTGSTRHKGGWDA